MACADIFGISEGLACIIVREFCKAVIKFIRPLVIRKWTPESLPHIAAEFEAKQGIPYIIGAIDGSHVPIIAPHIDPGPFYNRKGFHSIVTRDCGHEHSFFGLGCWMVWIHP